MTMRTGAGGYTDKVTILTRSLAAAATNGEEVESWPDPAAGTGQHYAKIEGPAAGETADATRAAFATLTVRFRHEVTITAVDHFRLNDGLAEYAVTGVRRERAPWGGWQTVVTGVGAE